MTFNWKKAAVIGLDLAITAYLFLAVTSFNHPEKDDAECTRVIPKFEKSVIDGFLSEQDVKALLKRDHLYPEGQPMSSIDIRAIEERLRQSPFVEKAECYKTDGGYLVIDISQRMPVVRVKALNGDDYYVDNEGRIMPDSRYTSDLVIATGNISQKYARQVLTPIGNLIVQDKFWRSQVEQLNVLSDGSMEMVPRVGDHIIYLGRPTNIKAKLERLQKFYKYGLSQAGWNKYAYISLEFDNQIICKKKQKTNI